MIIALEKDDGSLFLFESVSEAEAEFEVIDVENGEYEFCDDTGQRFIWEIVPVRGFWNGNRLSYRIRPSGSPDRVFLSGLVERASCLARSAGHIRTIDDFRKTQVA